MELSTEFNAGHDDLILSISFNYYGTKMLTSSSDQKLKLWKLVNKEWKLQDSVRAHDSAILETSWAHPEFGTLFCSGSFDRSIKIWEVDRNRVVERAKFLESKATVQDVAFAPNHLGLKLASCSADGVFRIHEAMDPMNPSSWTLLV